MQRPFQGSILQKSSPSRIIAFAMQPQVVRTGRDIATNAGHFVSIEGDRDVSDVDRIMTLSFIVSLHSSQLCQ